MGTRNPGNPPAGAPADGSVSTVKIADGAVTNAKLAGGITNAKLATDPLARANHTGTQTLATISDAGTAAAANTGTGANQVVKLDGAGKIPAVDGSLLTNLPGGADPATVLGPASASGNGFPAFDGSSGKLLKDSGKSYNDFLGVSNNLSDLDDAAAALANLGVTVGTAAGDVVALNGSGELPAVSGANLTDLPGGVTLPTGLASGTAGDMLFWAVDDTDVLRGAGVITANATNGNVAAHAADGNDGTWWQTGGGGGSIWWQDILSTAATVNHIRVLFYNGSYVPASFTLKADGVVVGTWSGGAADQSHDFDLTTASTWRLEFSNDAGSGGLAVKTIELRNASGQWSHIPIGSDGQALGVVAGVPAWKSATRGRFNVLDYGADPTGAVDSTAAFNAAIAAAAAALPSNTGQIYAPMGNYAIQGNLSSLAGCSLVGDGEALTVLTFSGQTGVHVDAASLVADLTLNSDASGTAVMTLAGTTVRNVTFVGSGSNDVKALYISGNGVTVTDCTFSSQDTALAELGVIYVESGARISIRGCRFISCTPDVGGTTALIYCEADSLNGSQIKDSMVSTSTYLYGVYLDAGASDHFIITGNDFSLAGTQAVHNGATGTHKLVNDNPVRA